MSRGRTALVVLVGATLTWMGCGDADDQTPEARGPAASTAEATGAPEEGEDDAFTAAANQVCERAVDGMNEIPAPSYDAEWPSFGQSIEVRFEQMVDELASLDPSQGLSGKLDK